jgi:hypothetical protein
VIVVQASGPVSDGFAVELSADTFNPVFISISFIASITIEALTADVSAWLTMSSLSLPQETNVIAVAQRVKNKKKAFFIVVFV